MNSRIIAALPALEPDLREDKQQGGYNLFFNASILFVLELGSINATSPNFRFIRYTVSVKINQDLTFFGITFYHYLRLQ